VRTHVRKTVNFPNIFESMSGGLNSSLFPDVDVDLDFDIVQVHDEVQVWNELRACQLCSSFTLRIELNQR
jgi:hypothetical protein